MVAERLKAGFLNSGVADVDGFLSFSLSVQNRRKSRAGYAFAHHVEAVLKAHTISYKREASTEMQAQSLQLVLPKSIHPTYHTDQQAWLMNIGEFLGLVKGS